MDVGEVSRARIRASHREDYSSDSGVALIMALWIISLLVLVSATMMIGSRFTLSSTESVMDVGRSRELVRLGVESWLTQLRGDVILDDVGVQPTEILNHDPVKPPVNVRINEAKIVDAGDYTAGVNPGMHVELVNVGAQKVDITGWFGRHLTGQGETSVDGSVHQLGPTRIESAENPLTAGFVHGDDVGDFSSTGRVWLCPLNGDGSCLDEGPDHHRFFVIGTPAFCEGDIGSCREVVPGIQRIKLCDETLTKTECFNAGPVTEGLRDFARFPFSCTGGSGSESCGLTWQVFPDGTHAVKPEVDHALTEGGSMPNNWVKAPSTMDPVVNGDPGVDRVNRSDYDLASGDAVGQANGSGIWLKVGNHEHEGIKLESYLGRRFNLGTDLTFEDLGRHGLLEGDNGLFGNGSAIRRNHTWNAPYCRMIWDECVTDYCRRNCNYRENFFVDTSPDAGDAMAVITNGLPRRALTEVFPSADTAYRDVNDHRHLVPVVPTGLIRRRSEFLGDTGFPSGAFPSFETVENHLLSLNVPEPRDQPLGENPPEWRRYRSTDRYDFPPGELGEARVVEGAPWHKKHGWLVRIDTGLSPADDLVRSGNVNADPDPGTYRPSRYTGSDGDYAFKDRSQADGHLYLSESYDSRIAASAHQGNSNEELVNPHCNLKITFARRRNSPECAANFLEIYNPGPEPYRLTKIAQKHEQGSGFRVVPDLWVGNQLLQPGEYFVVAEKNAPEFCGSGLTGGYVDAKRPSVGKGSSVGWRLLGRSSNHESDVVCDRLGVRRGGGPGTDWKEGEPIRNTGSEGFIVWRKKSGSFAEKVPRDLGDNRSDYEVFDPANPDCYRNRWHPEEDLKWGRGDIQACGRKQGRSNYHYFSRSFVELHQFGGPERLQEEGGEFIEIYNTGDTVDVTDLTVTDYLDGEGDPLPGGREYDLTLHPFDPFYPDGDGHLKPAQIGLILRNNGNIDPSEVGWRPAGIEPFLKGEDVDNDGRGDTVRIYTTRQSGEFLTGGLHDGKSEHVKLKDTRRVLSSGSWEEDCARVNRSCYKARIDGEQTADNWNNPSVYGGTPGKVGFVDHLGEDWSRGGSFRYSGRSVPMDEPLCLPSMRSCPDPVSVMRPGDIGYVEFVRIEDESGKINVVNPPILDSYDTEADSLRLGLGNEKASGNPILSDDPAVEGRSFLGSYYGYTPAKNLEAFPDTNPSFWMSPGGMMLADGVVPGRSTSRTNNMDDYEHVYTTMRSDTTNSRVNVNTASYEALKGIQVNPEGTTPTFMTDEMAREIIETRSCESNYRFGDTLPVENYECNNNNPYVSTIQACEQLNTTAHLPSLDCDVFTKTTTVSSGGIFRAEVRGVVVEDGAVQSESIWEVMVDRTGVERPSGSLEIIFLRERDDL